MTLETQLRETLRAKAARLPDPGNVDPHLQQLNVGRQMPRPLIAVGSFAVVILLIGAIAVLVPDRGAPMGATVPASLDDSAQDATDTTGISVPTTTRESTSLETQRAALTQNGLIYVAWSKGDMPSEHSTSHHATWTSLTGATVEAWVPDGIEIDTLTSQSGRTITVSVDSRTVSWRMLERGFGVLAMTTGGGTQATLIDAMITDNGVMAHYDLDHPLSGDEPNHFTLWQGATADLVSFDYPSLDDALASLPGLGISESTGQVTFTISGDIQLLDEMVGGVLIPSDHGLECEEGAGLLIRPVASAEILPGATEAGAWGEFTALNQGFGWGFQFRTDTAVATVEGFECEGPAAAPFLLEFKQDLLNSFRITWAGPDKQ